VDAYNHAIGYDLPFFQKFVNYLSNMFLHQDFGNSSTRPRTKVGTAANRKEITEEIVSMGEYCFTAA